MASLARNLSENQVKLTDGRQLNSARFFVYWSSCSYQQTSPRCLLRVGIFILVNPYICSLYCDYAHDLLVLFVHHFGGLYGRNMLVYNVHGLVHLVNDVRKFGSLDNVSSFPFENFLQSLKMVRKPTYPLPQMLKRMS